MQINFPTLPVIEVTEISAYPRTDLLQFINSHWEIISGTATLLVLILQAILIWRQSKIADKQTTLELLNFTATHRAKVIVRRVSLDKGSIEFPTPVSRIWKIQYVIANTGASEAKITEGNATAKIIKGELPAIPDLDDTKDIASGIKLKSGYNPSMIVILERDQIDYVRKCSMTNEPGSLYFFGYVQYEDGAGVVRRTAFCRRYNAITERFKPVTDDDYEYVE